MLLSAARWKLDASGLSRRPTRSEHCSKGELSSSLCLPVSVPVYFGTATLRKMIFFLKLHLPKCRAGFIRHGLMVPSPFGRRASRSSAHSARLPRACVYMPHILSTTLWALLCWPAYLSDFRLPRPRGARARATHAGAARHKFGQDHLPIFRCAPRPAQALPGFLINKYHE